MLPYGTRFSFRPLGGSIVRTSGAPLQRFGAGWTVVIGRDSADLSARARKLPRILPVTEHAGKREGFTLIEVLVAMVILALGLLGLEALGIGAARSIALAERQSDYATIASDSLESALFQLRQGGIPMQFCRTDLPFQDKMSREVDLTNPQLAQVTVTVIPNPESYNAPQSNFEISSSLYLQAAPAGVLQGSPCD